MICDNMHIIINIMYVCLWMCTPTSSYTFLCRTVMCWACILFVK